MKEEKKLDLTNKEDLSLAVMNLISIEEHLIFTAMKTGKDVYLEIMKEVRKLRIKLLKRLVQNTEGEVWCISKHLLAATMRLLESSTKFRESDAEFARDLKRSALDLYSLFWFLQKIGGKNDVKKSGEKIRKTKK